jgi:hypothetical protein
MNVSEESQKSQIAIYVILFAFILSGFFLRLPPVTFNLPVASHADERIGVARLEHFYNGSLDPGTFTKPTFYYYLTYFIARPFVRDALELVFYGRVVNCGHSSHGLSCSCLSFSGFFARFCYTRPYLVSILALLLFLTSPFLLNILAKSGIWFWKHLERQRNKLRRAPMGEFCRSVSCQ